MNLKAIALQLSALALATVPLGCGGSSATVKGPDFGSDEGTKIARMISNFDDAKADARKFAACFAEKPPAQWKFYSTHMFEVQGKPVINGDSATATINIRPDGIPGEPFTKEWTFVKAGADWKLKDAPLK